MLALPPDVEADASDASAELSRFDAEMGGEIAPFGWILLRSESAASSQIEDLTASARAIAEAELGVGQRRNANLIIGNTRAMEAAIDLADRLDETAILRMHEALLRDADPTIAGRWRTEPVWIGGTTIGPHEADFVPPRYESVEPAIRDLVGFIRRDDMPVLPQVAVAHAQFETIHPFPDGNGRTGRALVQAMLRSKDLTRNVTIPISAGLLADTEGYFSALTAYRRGDPTEIVTELGGAAFRAVENGRHLVADVRSLRSTWNDRITARRDSRAWAVADLVMRRPVVNAAVVAAELDISVSNAYRYLEPLERADVLVEFTDKKRNRIWRAPEVLTALDEFAARAGRRTRG